jgi:hypothetical protein
VQELARAHTIDAVEALVEALKRPKEAVPAAVALLNRAWGMPVATIHAQSQSTVLHLLAAQALGRELQAELGAPATASAEPQPAVIDLQAIPPPLE